jgi:hypothetical protein
MRRGLEHDIIVERFLALLPQVLIIKLKDNKLRLPNIADFVFP